MENYSNEKYNNLILWAIILIAIALRIFFPFEIPFTHDELSAILRTHYPSFSELIEGGVKPDGHPAGIQVFLYYWTKLFGYTEIIVKLPFIVFGILAVFFTYKIAQEWFNSTVGIICAAFVSTLQYPVMYSQIARPYISGLFFSMLMVYYWTKVVTQPQKRLYIDGLIYIIASSLCAYNHYFSLLFAMIVGFTGLFVISKKYIFQYILFGIVIFFTFIPHLNIFLYQFKMGGVEGWLGKPHNNFLIEYIKYIFHFSPFVLILVIGIIVLGVLKIKKKDINSKNLIISLCWFILPFLIGFFYSKYVNSVLQYSVLIFSFPFFLFFIFGYLPKFNVKQTIALVSLILLVNTLSLILERKHYSVFYNSPFEQILVQHDLIKKSNADCISIIDSDKGISKYYTNKLALDTNFVWYSSFPSIKKFINYLQVQDKKNLYFGCVSGSNPLLVSIIQDYYPYIVWQKDYFTGTSYLFSKIENKSIQKPIFSSMLNFEEEPINWSIGNKNNWVDTISFQGEHSYFMDSTQEWSPTFSTKLKDIINNKNNFINISLNTLIVDSPEEVLLVSSLESKERIIHWGATSFDTYSPKKTEKKEWVKIHHTIKLSDSYLNYPDIMIKVYVWNKGKRKLFIDNFEIKTRKGNPIVYGLLEKI